MLFLDITKKFTLMTANRMINMTLVMLFLIGNKYIYMYVCVCVERNPLYAPFYREDSTAN